MNKYHAKKTEIDGIVFDSQKEARRWGELALLRRAHEIKDLERQVKFELGINGVKVCDYFCDFHYYERGPGSDWRLVVEDVKSEVTRKLAVYRIKKKLMRAIHGIDIRET